MMNKAQFFVSVSKVFLISLLLVYFTVDGLVFGQEHIQEEKFMVEISAYPEEKGTVNGSGYYEEGEKITVVATANEGYVFANWLEEDIAVSSEESYTFKVTENRELVGIFIPKEKSGGDKNES